MARRPGLGSVVRRGDGRWGITWNDGSGRRRWERLPDRSVDGKPLTEKSIRAEGRRRLAEYGERSRRQRHGLEPAPSESLDLPFGELYGFWWDHHGKMLKSDAVGPFTRKHLGPLWRVPLREVTSARIRKLLVDASGALRPKSLNHLRAFIHNMFSVASQPGGPWEGRANPVAAVPTFKVTPRPKAILEVHEFEPVLACVDERWRGPVAVGLYAGLREGEVFGLLKQDVDLERGVILVSRSWEADRTKDGKAAPVPIAPQLRPHLERALREAPGRLVFPAEGGAMHSRKLRLNRPLRAAIARAGLVTGYEHRCLSAGCGHVAPSPEASAPETCPSCGKATLWSKPIPRHVTFHGTRHSFGTAMVRRAGMAVAQKALRHSDVRLTIHTYGHLDDGDLRDGIAKAFGPG
jgi:integrase